MNFKLKTILLISAMFLGISTYSQNIKKVTGVTDTSIKKVSSISDTNIKKVNGVTFGTTLLLDTYTGASVAYSVRKLRTAYAGYCMKVRRTSDNTEQDIGFTANGDLDTSAIKTFCSTSSGYVRTWYDQSGNAINATTTENSQRICNAGVICRASNGIPAVQYISGEPLAFVTTANLIVGSSQHYSIGVFADDLEGQFFDVVDISNNIVASAYCSSGGSFGSFNNYAVGDNIDNSISDPGVTIFEINYANSSTVESYVNNARNSIYNLTGTYSPGTDVVASYVGTAYGINHSYPCANLQEIIIYPSNQSSNRSSIYTNVNTYF